jgi:N,N'-diacetyllegionaminate synthase
LTANDVFIIAEAGVNHNGNIELAKKLIDVAVESGADAVKFQSFKADSLVSKFAEKAEYQKQSTGGDESQYEMLKRLELDFFAHEVLINYCNEKNIQFLSTPFDSANVDMLNNFGMKIFKIPSGEITNLPYLSHIGGLNKEVILSTGMADLGEIEDALEILISNGLTKDKITVLHATTEYPCPVKDVNLRAMQTIAKAFGVRVGYSDHTMGIEVSLAAVAMGASVIEKHFTLDRSMDGPDHQASLEPSELIEMVRSIRSISCALGSSVKKITQSELKNRDIARKSIVASMPIKQGDTFSTANLTAKRPGTGISPMRWNEILGVVASRDYDSGDQI